MNPAAIIVHKLIMSPMIRRGMIDAHLIIRRGYGYCVEYRVARPKLP
jgi:hypothetical protein